MIELAIFDMDYTVLSVDCDHSWKYFLADKGLAPATHRAEADRFLDLYHQGRTPVNEYIEFQLSEFARRSIDEMKSLADQHFKQRIIKYIFPEARDMIDQFNRSGISTIMLTGTNRVIAEPVAKALGISILIATELEIKDGYFSGRVDGLFLMREAKLQSASDLCTSMRITLDHVTYIADGITDVPLLEKVGYPVVINPRKDLLSIAKANKWQIKNWRINNNSASISAINSEIDNEGFSSLN